MSQREQKLRVTTEEVEGATLHDHQLQLPEGAIAAGEYETTEEDGHTHTLVIETELPTGNAVELTTSEDGAGPHSHAVKITAGTVDGPDFRSSDDPPELRSRQGGRVVETKVVERNGIKVGEVNGYIATWDIDSGGVFGVPDRFEPGAFAESLAVHRARGNRPLRLKDHHGRTVGGFPIDRVREDATGLYGEGEINLEVQQGREAFSLARQGVLSDFSIGFSSQSDRIVDGIRVISKAIVWEGSIVDEPANQSAQILEVKSHQFPDAGALRAASDILIKSRASGMEENEFVEAVLNLERQFAAFGETSPFDEKDRQFFTVVEVKEFTRRDFEAALASTGRFSKSAAKTLASRLAVSDVEPASYDGLREILDTVQEIKESLKRR